MKTADKLYSELVALKHYATDTEYRNSIKLIDAFAKERAVEFAESTWDLDGDYYNRKILAVIYDKFINEH